MHLENFAPLLGLWPFFALIIIGSGTFFWFERGRHRREARAAEARSRRYWAAEFAYRARLRAKEWLTRTKTPRLTYQGSALDEPEAGRKRRK